jgi:hypothetical protein
MTDFKVSVWVEVGETERQLVSSKQLNAAEFYGQGKVHGK